MPRFEPLSAPYPEPLASDLARIMPPDVPPLQLFRTIGRSERHWTRFAAGGLLAKGPLPLREREVVILRTCANCGSDYEWGVHVALFAKRTGFLPEEVQQIAGSGPPTILPPRERLLVAAVDALSVRKRWSDAEFVEFSATLSEAELFEIIALTGFYHTVAFWTNALALPLEPGTSPIPAKQPGARA
jgi:alkylhydroperoxidase family enzyme